MEDEGGDDEGAEEEDLDAEAAEYDILARAGVVTGLGRGEKPATWEGEVSACCRKGAGLEREDLDVPPLWAQKDRTSPRTKILVSHFGLMTEYGAASRRVARRPRIM